MSTAVKWATLAAGAVVLVALILVLPVTDYMNTSVLGNAVNALVSVIATPLQAARGFLNFFLDDWAITALSGLLLWIFGKQFLTIAIKITTWIYHFIFRG